MPPAFCLPADHFDRPEARLLSASAKLVWLVAAHHCHFDARDGRITPELLKRIARSANLRPGEVNRAADELVATELWTEPVTADGRRVFICQDAATAR